ncbi:MAG: DUF1552 domain-containing protein, partial [Sandaracinaceae bacterium]
APLAGFEEKLLILDGVDIDPTISIGASHTKGPALLWTAAPLLEDQTCEGNQMGDMSYLGWDSAPSVDQGLGRTLGEGLRDRNLEVGARTGGYAFPGSRTIYRGPAQPVTPIDDPAVAFHRVFGDGRPVSELEQLRLERRSVLDVLRAELSSIRGRVAAGDREKLDHHLESVRDVEMSLSGEICEAPAGLPGPALSSANVPGILHRNMQILVGAMRCDMTRVGSVQMSIAENDGIVYPWAGVGRGAHHLISHESDAAGQADLALIYRWYAEQFASLVGMLDAIPEGGGTMLDHTLVVWGSELGVGYNHSFNNVPFVVAGGGGLGVDTGRYLQLGGMQHNRLLVSLCQALGRPDIETFGPMDPGTGGIPGFFV